MIPGQTFPCPVPLDTIQGSGFNTVAVPGELGAQYKSVTEQLLYEIWSTNLLILAANPPAMSKVLSFVAGDGQAGSPAVGAAFLETPALQGETIFNKQLLVVREGIPLLWNQPTGVLGQIRRYNHAGNGGWVFEGGLVFNAAERYDVYIVSINTTDNV